MRYNDAMQATPEVLEPPRLEIKPAKRGIDLDLPELWEYRQLLYFFAWRDVKVRYKQTLLGASWAVLQPLLATLVFVVFFGRVADLSSGDTPYVLFTFVAMTAWTFFSTGATNAAASLVSGASMITKVYFPRLALPISAVAGAAVDFLCASVMLVPLMAFYTVSPTIRIVALPLFFAIATAASLGVGAMFAALNVRYRDVRYIIPFLMQLWLFATPIVYASSSLSERWRTVYAINPMVGVVDGFRWCLLADGPRPGWTTIVSALAAVTMLIGGVAYFRATEDSFADVI